LGRFTRGAVVGAVGGGAAVCGCKRSDRAGSGSAVAPDSSVTMDAVASDSAFAAELSARAVIQARRFRWDETVRELMAICREVAAR